MQFDLKGLYQDHHTLQIHQPTVLHPQEDRGSLPCPQPMTTECIHCTTGIQNGDYGDDMSFNKQKRLYDFARSTRCFSPCPNPPSLTLISTVSLERETVPIQSPAIQSLLDTTCLHQGTTPDTTVGMGTRHQDISIP